MSIIKKTVIGISLLLSACGSATEPSNTKLKKTPETIEMLANFSKQKHQFEFSGCEMKYNGVPFSPTMTIQELENILGPISRTSSAKLKEKNNAYFWFEGIIRILENKKEKKVNSININFTSITDKNSPFYIKIEGAPLNNLMNMGQFVEKSNYEFDDFYVDRFGYNIDFTNCPYPVKYYYFSKVNFSYIGNGHIRLKDKPDFRTTQPIKILEISHYKK